MTKPKLTAATPMNSETRAPQMTRENTSRPMSSPPNQCAADGAVPSASASLTLGSSMNGRYGARIARVMSPTSQATAIQKPTPSRRTSRWTSVAPASPIAS